MLHLFAFVIFTIYLHIFIYLSTNNNTVGLYSYLGFNIPCQIRGNTVSNHSEKERLCWKIDYE